VEPSTVVASFLARWQGQAPSDAGELERCLLALHARGQAAWPRVAVAAADFAAFVGERAATDAAALPALERLQAEDLYLTCGCVRGQADALAAFDAQLMTRVPLYIASLRLSETVLDEVRQLLRHKLFTGEGGAPGKVAHYNGSGALDSWLRVTAMRAALNLLAAEKSHTPLDEAEGVGELLAPGDDPELDWIKARYRATFGQALRQSFQRLSQRDRNLLRFQFLDGMTPARVGSVYGVHRTTVMRWVAEAQEQLFTHTHQILCSELKMSAQECDSLLELVRSRLDMTLRTLFKSEAN
jgi:RNA polymerase sigma-70 factor (ECF subfamily)